MSFPWRNLYELNTLLSSPRSLAKSEKLKPTFASKLFDYTVMCHVGHGTDFAIALVYYLFFFPSCIAEAHTISLSWMWKVYAYNFAVMLIFYGGWHYVLYGSSNSKNKVLHDKKYNQNDQYDDPSHLPREIAFTTLGFLQSATYQVVITHLWAAGYVPYYNDFWKYPAYSLFWLVFVTYFREFHFYWAHRAMHPWKWGLPVVGDVGDFLYKNVHKLHHKSFNPGPWSGLSMHPVEHFIYYTVTLTCLFVPLHPIHFFYCKFHADVAPIGGHDGYASPGGGADFHYLHHAKFECNYGVPLIDFDRLFGTWVEYDDYVAKEQAKKSGRGENKSKTI